VADSKHFLKPTVFYFKKHACLNSLDGTTHHAFIAVCYSIGSTHGWILHCAHVRRVPAICLVTLKEKKKKTWVICTWK